MHSDTFYIHSEIQDRVALTADWHIGHENILHLCDRPWDVITDMDYALVTALQEFDPLITFHLGDFSLYSARRYRPYLARILDSLPGYHVLILGNHDSYSYRVYEEEIGFDQVLDWATLWVGASFEFTLVHDYETALAMPGFLNSTAALVGHVHATWDICQRHGFPPAINVGVDTTLSGYRPVSLSCALQAYSQFYWDSEQGCA